MKRQKKTNTSSGSGKSGIFGRILLVAVGACLIMYGCGSLVLGAVGVRTTATVTSVRRQGGERAETVPNRYTYSVGYAFSLPDGREIAGTTTKIAGPLYIKADGSSSISVCYLAFAPFFNLPEEDTALTFGQPVLATAGALLLYVAWHPKQKKKAKK